MFTQPPFKCSDDYRLDKKNRAQTYRINQSQAESSVSQRDMLVLVWMLLALTDAEVVRLIEICDSANSRNVAKPT